MRRGMGTRFWSLNELITHVVVPSRRGEEVSCVRVDFRR
jgi:hypothetical protein